MTEGGKKLSHPKERVAEILLKGGGKNIILFAWREAERELYLFLALPLMDQRLHPASTWTGRTRTRAREERGARQSKEEGMCGKFAGEESFEGSSPLFFL